MLGRHFLLKTYYWISFSGRDYQKIKDPTTSKASNPFTTQQEYKDF